MSELVHCGICFYSLNDKGSYECPFREEIAMQFDKSPCLNFKNQYEVIKQGAKE